MNRDLEVYRELRNWLPPNVFDCHVHVSLARHCGQISPERMKKNWAMEVACEMSWDDLWTHYERLFPDQRLRVIAFGNVYREVDLDSNNEYILSGVRNSDGRAYGLFAVAPQWAANKTAEAFAQGFVGIKPYPDLAGKDDDEISIFEFVPHEHLSVVNEHAGVLMLHLPRKGRLADPENIRELLEIRERYPAIRIVVAHIGRAFTMPTVEKGLPHFADVPGLFFDIAANLNADVMEYALGIVGPDRLLFGSDLPITLMRGMREHIGETYINYTDGPYSWNVNRKSPEEEARYTYFLYEELLALKAAIERAGLKHDAVHKIMYENAAGLIDAVRTSS